MTTTAAERPVHIPPQPVNQSIENGLDHQLISQTESGLGRVPFSGSSYESIFQRIRHSILHSTSYSDSGSNHGSGPQPALRETPQVDLMPNHASNPVSHAPNPLSHAYDPSSPASNPLGHASDPTLHSTRNAHSSHIRTIEWNMMDKYKFFPLSVLSSFSVRCLLYPFTVIKTRIQIQRHSEVYKGTFDAFYKIFKYEGVSGLYRGFWVSAFQLVSGIFYITTYENVRHFLKEEGVQDSRLRALVGGGCASLVGQTIIVPFDVISQHMMVLGQKEGSGKSADGRTGRRRVVVNPLNIEYRGRGRVTVALDIVKTVYRMDGLRGFYRGYLASISAYVPNSALWWTFYHFYQDQLSKVSPKGTSTLLLQCVAAPLGGVTTSLLTNPLDIIRARLQVQRTGSFAQTFRTLWAEEQLGIFTKGLSPRLFQSVVFSFMIILGYESVKRVSVSEEFKEEVRW